MNINHKKEEIIVVILISTIIGIVLFITMGIVINQHFKYSNYNSANCSNFTNFYIDSTWSADHYICGGYAKYYINNNSIGDAHIVLSILNEYIIKTSQNECNIWTHKLSLINTKFTCYLNNLNSTLSYGYTNLPSVNSQWIGISFGIIFCIPILIVIYNCIR